MILGCFSVVVGYYDGKCLKCATIPRATDKRRAAPVLLVRLRHRPARGVRLCFDHTFREWEGVAEKRAPLREKGRIYITHPSFPFRPLGSLACGCKAGFSKTCAHKR